MTQAPDLLPPDSYINQPKLDSFTQNSQDGISNRVLREVQVCKLLRQQPHPNIAYYHGCQVKSGLITGLWFAKYTTTAMENVNPSHHGKRAFKLDPKSLPTRDEVLSGMGREIRQSPFAWDRAQ